MSGYEFSKSVNQKTLDEVEIELEEHVERTDNPHNVTKEQVGLGNVENIKPEEMPVSQPQKEYIDEEIPTQISKQTAGWQARISNNELKIEALNTTVSNLNTQCSDLNTSIKTEIANRETAIQAEQEARVNDVKTLNTKFENYSTKDELNSTTQDLQASINKKQDTLTEGSGITIDSNNKIKTVVGTNIKTDIAIGHIAAGETISGNLTMEQFLIKMLTTTETIGYVYFCCSENKPSQITESWDKVDMSSVSTTSGMTYTFNALNESYLALAFPKSFGLLESAVIKAFPIANLIDDFTWTEVSYENKKYYMYVKNDTEIPDNETWLFTW